MPSFVLEYGGLDVDMAPYGGELDSTGLDAASVACPGSKEAWLNTLGLTLCADTNYRMAA